MQRDKNKGIPRPRWCVGKVKDINYACDTANYKKRLKRIQFLIDFENAGNLSRKVMSVKITASTSLGLLF